MIIALRRMRAHARAPRHPDVGYKQQDAARGDRTAWIEGKDLRISTDTSASASVPMTAAGTQLASEPWSFAFWGRGTLLALPPLPVPDTDDQILLGVRVMTMFDEVGVAARREQDAIRFEVVVRTAWSNPRTW